MTKRSKLASAQHDEHATNTTSSDIDIDDLCSKIYHAELSMPALQNNEKLIRKKMPVRVQIVRQKHGEDFSDDSSSNNSADKFFLMIQSLIEQPQTTSTSRCSTNSRSNCGSTVLQCFRLFSKTETKYEGKDHNVSKEAMYGKSKIVGMDKDERLFKYELMRFGDENSVDGMAAMAFQLRFKTAAEFSIAMDAYSKILRNVETAASKFRDSASIPSQGRNTRKRKASCLSDDDYVDDYDDDDDEEYPDSLDGMSDDSSSVCSGTDTASCYDDEDDLALRQADDDKPTTAWTDKMDQKWLEKFEMLKKYKKKHGNC
eukprot:CAMPEP_0116045566 /NCGR_PEP_ID=MMETSP0321-20121206/27689_1 /TAXON_ID=163516 /ORGANISM="Leptocylindrus danicus var. danicus, Strain B650" /LENGTH=314 /DNA_ID=CAMNT_0003526913 /DNA_START=9 /DNA_END=950 /DNA_ORIENTATION=-